MGNVGIIRSPVRAIVLLDNADKLRGTAQLNAHANSLGLTGLINASNLDDQEHPLQLWRQNKLTIRMRPLFPADSPQEVETRIPQ